MGTTSLPTTVLLNTSFYNTTLNITTPVPGGGGGRGPPPPYMPTYHDWLLIGAFLIIMISGVVGNVLVIYVFGKKRDLKTTEYLILYLGVIDLMTSVFNPSLNIYWIYYGFRTWHFGELGCKILPAIGPIMTTASGWVLLIFAAERYCAIVTPFTKRFTPGLIKLLCLGAVAISAGMYVHYSVALTHKFYGGRCVVPDVKVPEYGYPNCAFIIVRLLSFLSVFLLTNIRIYMTLRQNESRFSAKDLRETRNKQSKRIMRILNAMGIVFVVLVFPRELLYLVYNMNDMIYQGAPDKGVQFGEYVIKLNAWLKVMHTSNSCANIFIYANMQDSYKRQIRKILEWLGCSKYRFKRGLNNYLPGVNSQFSQNNNPENDDGGYTERVYIGKEASTSSGGSNSTTNEKRGLFGRNRAESKGSKRSNGGPTKMFNSNHSIYRRKDHEKGEMTTFFKRAEHFRNYNALECKPLANV
ncbi:neuropeptides B/W receptor type 1-like [Clytia hemisphaerica]|uniref:neuropeptides B/W receptor type 1-like n=1 Tax=Clytia hemisphaerica TaxID=252671 RepID=UPI0034D3B1AF